MNASSKCDYVPIKPLPNSGRMIKLSNLFEKEFGCKPEFFVRMPGRVNIIGEHIDYCGYPVLPMALEQDILVACGTVKQLVLRLKNTNSEYESFETILNSAEEMQIKLDANEKPRWFNYVLCGVKGAIEYLDSKIASGVQLYIDGNVPPASGLSSSSALVSASCLSFLYSHKAYLSRTEIASLCAKSERYIGTQGGGMDQAIAFLAEKYSAQYITWNPLKATSVALPKGIAFVVAHSQAEANKAATNDFNRRVIECRLAAQILLLANSKDVIIDKKIITLSEVQNYLDATLEEMIALVYKLLPKEIYTKVEICDMLGLSQNDLDELFLTANTRQIEQFKLKQRALHVYEEAMRVEKFKSICMHSTENGKVSSNGNTNGNKERYNKTITALGQLIAESHQSLKNLYECSHDNLDKLVHISREFGVHSRLTGAGWGGCIVALCPEEKVDEYMQMLKTEFYEKLCYISGSKADKYVFATTPNYGATIFV